MILIKGHRKTFIVRESWLVGRSVKLWVIYTAVNRFLQIIPRNNNHTEGMCFSVCFGGIGMPQKDTINTKDSLHTSLVMIGMETRGKATSLSHNIPHFPQGGQALGSQKEKRAMTGNAYV